MSIKRNTAASITRLKLVRQRIDEKIKFIQDVECTHPKVIVVHRADTGNWCKADDRYWTENTCQDCGKLWIEEK